MGRSREFTVKQRQRLSWQTQFAHRPTNDWGMGDLPAPYAEGDLLYLPEDADTERLHDMTAGGYFVVGAAFSIDEGDAWYFRVTDGDPDRRNSDRLHVAFAARSSWDEDIDYMGRFKLIDTADPHGLTLRELLLEQGWEFKARQRCLACGSLLGKEMCRSEVHVGLSQESEGDRDG